MLSTEKVGNKLCGLGKYIAKQSPYCIFWTLIFHRIVGNLVDFGLRFWLNLDFSAPYSSLNNDCGNHTGPSNRALHRQRQRFRFGQPNPHFPCWLESSRAAFCSMSDVSKPRMLIDWNCLFYIPPPRPVGRRSLVNQAIFVPHRRPIMALTPLHLRDRNAAARVAPRPERSRL